MNKIAIAILCILNMSWICVSAQTPTTQASNITWTSGGSSNITLSWTNGNGANRLLVGSTGQSVDFTPTDNTTYTANSNFGSGQNVGGGMYVIYKGSGSSITINSLSSNNQYTFRLYEYNGSAGAEKYLTTTSGTSGALGGSNCGGSGGGSSYGCTLMGNPYTVAYNSGTQATNLVFQSTTSTSINALYYPDGKTSILVASTAPLAGTPVGSNKYCASSTYGAGDLIGTGYVVAAFNLNNN